MRTKVQTDDLIEQLSSRVPSVPRHAALRRLAVCAGGGAVAATALLVIAFGVRPDIASASATVPFWMKWAFTVTLSVAAFAVLRRVVRPEGRIGALWLGIAMPIGMVMMFGAFVLIRAPASQRTGLWLGETALRCPAAILLLATPVFAALLVALRRQAPTRLGVAGGAAGLLAGSVGASVYALTCPEQSPAFMATWYVAGILAATLIGVVVGRRLLRW